MTRSTLATVVVTLELTACGSSAQPSSGTATPHATPSVTFSTMTCKLNLQFGDSLSGIDVSTRQVTVTGSGADQRWLVDAMGNGASIQLGWSRHSVSLYAPGSFAGGAVSSPAGLIVSADGMMVTFTDITVSAQVGGTASVNGTVDCAGS